MLLARTVAIMTMIKAVVTLVNGGGQSVRIQKRSWPQKNSPRKASLCVCVARLGVYAIHSGGLMSTRVYASGLVVDRDHDLPLPFGWLTMPTWS